MTVPYRLWSFGIERENIADDDGKSSDTLGV